MAFQSFELTNEGINLLAQVQAELGSLNFTQIKIGDGDYTGDIKDLTDIISEFHNFPVTSTQVQPDSSVKIQAPFTNETFTQAYTWREIGIYAKLGDTGVEILYSYSKDPTPDTIPSYDGGANIYRRTLDIRNYISDVDSVTLEIVELTNKYDFNTVAEMQAASYIVDGDRIKLWGYYALGDGGEHERIISTIPGLFSIPVGTFYANLIYDDYVNILHIGAEEGGITDVSSLIQSILNNNVNVYIPVGTFKVSQIIPVSFCRIKGAEGKQAILVSDGDIEFFGAPSPIPQRFEVHSIDFQLNEGNDLHIKDCVHSHFLDIFTNGSFRISGFTYNNRYRKIRMQGDDPQNPGDYGFYFEDPDCADIILDDIAIRHKLKHYILDGGSFVNTTWKSLSSGGVQGTTFPTSACFTFLNEPILSNMNIVDSDFEQFEKGMDISTINSSIMSISISNTAFFRYEKLFSLNSSHNTLKVSLDTCNISRSYGPTDEEIENGNLQDFNFKNCSLRIGAGSFSSLRYDNIIGATRQTSINSFTFISGENSYNYYEVSQAMRTTSLFVDRHANLNVPLNSDVLGTLSVGSHRFNTTSGKPEWYNGTVWVDATGTPV